MNLFLKIPANNKTKQMTMKFFSVLFISMIFIHLVNGQAKEISNKKNNVFILLNNHLEKRGSENYYTSNPDFSVGYERDLFGFGKNRFYAGIRTGAYKEYVLTGYGWSHPEKTRFFIGLSPSYVLNISKKFRLQVNLLYDVLLPDDYDEIWSYWAVEPSFQYFVKNFYVGISAATGVFLFFDPKAYMDKAGLKLGYRF